MTPLQAIILGLVQGLTEFLPISSTAHLRIVPYFLGWDDPGAAFSAAIQLGTLAAVFVYFAGDVQRLTLAAIDGLRHRDLRRTPDTLLAWSIVPASIPIVVLGLGFKDSIENEARALWIIATALIVLALLLLLAERVSRRDRSLGQLTFWRIQIIGLCQALALVPGCSRSGSTIMGGLFVGLERAEAARFSFLLGLPAIGGAGLLKLLELLAERFALTHQVGLLKANLELEAVDTVREAQKLANLRALCEEYELNPDFVTVLFTSIMEEVVRNHRRLQEL